MSIWALKLKKHITSPLDEIILSLDQFGKGINLFACVNFIFKSTFKIFLCQLKVSKFHTNIFRGPKINRSFNIDLSTVKLYLQDSEKRQFRIFDRFVKTICGLHCWTKIFWDLVTFRKKYWQFKCQWQSNVMGCFAMVNKY